MSTRDYRNLCIEQLADELAAMTERALLAEANRDTWKLIAVRAIHCGHELYLETQRDSLTRLRDENRQLREALLREPMAA